MKMKNLVTHIIILILCAKAQSQNLTFDKLLKERTAPFNAKEILVDFHFVNTSGKEITITKFDAPCKCMFAELEGGVKVKSGRIFKPDAKGVFKGRFVLEGFQGTIDKGIVVWLATDNPKEPSIKLVARATVPERFTITPSSLKWDRGGENKEKILSIIVNGDPAVHIKSLTCSNPNFKCEIITVKKGREYNVKIKPNRLEHPTMGVLWLMTDSKIHRDKMIQAFLMVNQSK